MSGSVDRRELLLAGIASAGLAAATLTLSPRILRTSAAAPAPDSFTRYRIGSPQGAQNRLVYRRPVSAMLERSRVTDDIYKATDPLGWTFQGMMHGILTRQQMQSEIEAKHAALRDFF